jgi:hypothetical protein
MKPDILILQRHAAGNMLSIDDQWRKLALVVDTAQKIWG